MFTILSRVAGIFPAAYRDVRDPDHPVVLRGDDRWCLLPGARVPSACARLGAILWSSWRRRHSARGRRRRSATHNLATVVWSQYGSSLSKWLRLWLSNVQASFSTRRVLGSENEFQPFEIQDVASTRLFKNGNMQVNGSFHTKHARCHV